MEPVKRLKREVRAKGTVITLYKDTVVANGIEEEWDYIHHDGAASVVAVNEDGKLLMVRQYRNALDRFTLELPAGKLDEPGESTLECAKRELEEESGVVAKKIEYLGEIFTTVAIFDEKIHLYLATELEFKDAHPDEDEFLEVENIPLKKLYEMVMNGEIKDAKTQIAILKAYNILCK